jgi:hypothetical protein
MSQMDSTLYDAQARVNAIYPIHMIGDPEHPPEWLEEISSFLDSPAVVSELNNFPELAYMVHNLDDYGSSKDVGMAIAKAWATCARHGFMVFASVCVRTYLSPDTFYSGWGHTQLIWFLVEYVDQIEPELLKRASALHASQAKKMVAA